MKDQPHELTWKSRCFAALALLDDLGVKNGTVAAAIGMKPACYVQLKRAARREHPAADVPAVARVPTFTDQELLVLSNRFQIPEAATVPTLQELALTMHVSGERVRQIEAHAMAKLHCLVKAP